MEAERLVKLADSLPENASIRALEEYDRSGKKLSRASYGFATEVKNERKGKTDISKYESFSDKLGREFAGLSLVSGSYTQVGNIITFSYAATDKGKTIRKAVYNNETKKWQSGGFEWRDPQGFAWTADIGEKGEDLNQKGTKTVGEGGEDIGGYVWDSGTKITKKGIDSNSLIKIDGTHDGKKASMVIDSKGNGVFEDETNQRTSRITLDSNIEQDKKELQSISEEMRSNKFDDFANAIDEKIKKGHTTALQLTKNADGKIAAIGVEHGGKVITSDFSSFRKGKRYDYENLFTSRIGVDKQQVDIDTREVDHGVKLGHTMQMALSRDSALASFVSNPNLNKYKLNANVQETAKDLAEDMDKWLSKKV